MSISLFLAACLVGTPAPAKPVAQRYKWDNVTIVGGGFVSGILFHPKQKGLAYARTDIGGAYRWDPKGKRWMPLVDWIQRPDWNLYGIESIGLDPKDPKRLYLACGTYMGDFAGNGAILRSTDQGKTFKRTDMPFKMGGNQDGRSIGERLAVDPNKGNILFFGSRSAGLWRSENFGETWKQVDSFPIKSPTNGIGVGLEVFAPKGAKPGQPTATIYVGVASSRTGLYRSTDAGQTWSPVPGQPTGMYPHHGAIDADGNLILTYANGPGPNGLTDGAVWKFNTESGAWTDISPVHPKDEHGFGYAGLSIDPEHKGTMIVSSLDRWNPGDDVFRTTDGGVHWSSLKSVAVMDGSGSPFLYWGQKAPRFGWWMGTAQIDPFDSNHILFGTGATIWGTDDLVHWTTRAQGLEETAVIDLISPPAGAHLFSALGDIGGFRHDDFKVAPPEGMMLNPLLDNTDSIDFAERDPLVMARVGRAGNGVRRGGYSLDGGHTWQPFATEPTGSRGSGQIAVSADGSILVWAPQGAHPSFTHDHGSTWTECAGAPNNLHVIADRVQAETFYGYDSRSGTLYISKDRGASFAAAATGLPKGESRIRAVPDREGDLWLAAGHSLYHSSNGGSSFSKNEGASDVSTFGFGKAAPGRTYPSIFLIGAAEGAQGAFRSDDMGQSWILITDADHGYGTMDQIIGDPRIFGRVYIGMNGRGVLFGDPAVR